MRKSRFFNEKLKKKFSEKGLINYFVDFGDEIESKNFQFSLLILSLLFFFWDLLHLFSGDFKIK